MSAREKALEDLLETCRNIHSDPMALRKIHQHVDELNKLDAAAATPRIDAMPYVLSISPEGGGPMPPQAFNVGAPALPEDALDRPLHPMVFTTLLWVATLLVTLGWAALRGGS